MAPGNLSCLVRPQSGLCPGQGCGRRGTGEWCLVLYSAGKQRGAEGSWGSTVRGLQRRSPATP